MLRLHSLEHEHYEGTANIGRWASANSFLLSRTLLYAGQDLPDIETLDWLVIMGGPMSAYEEDSISWLKKEKQFIKEAIQKGKAVLGVCLGAQLLADVLGAKVYAGPVGQEIGFHQVLLTESGVQSSFFAGFDRNFSPLHWHGDTFSLPQGAKLLAASRAYPHQAFQYGDRVLALQFHLELSIADVADFFTQAGEPPAAPFVQSSVQILSKPELFAENETLLQRLLDNCLQLWK